MTSSSMGSSELVGKIALVTGGLGGIGRATVQAFLAQGACLAFTYAAGQESLSDAQALVDSAPDKLSLHALDLRDIGSIQAVIQEAQARWGRLDILVNNAAVGSATVSRYTEDRFVQDTAMFSINADGTLKMCQMFLERVRAQHNPQALKLINVSSVGGGVQAFPGFRLSDGMSKAGVAFMTRQLAAELVHEPIDVFALCPGATRTKMFESSTLDLMTEQEREVFLARLPKRRLIEPHEMAQIIAFLAGPHSTPMHGAVIDASMGLGVRPGLQTEA